MIHKHFKEISSTQQYLKDELSQFQGDTLISCESQIAGVGQYDRTWDSYNETLCCSFLFSPNKVLTLTSLELACLVHKYFHQKYQINLKLKWPNDIINTKAEKVGGILLNHIDKKMVVGIGLNFNDNDIDSKKNYKTAYGIIFEQYFKFDKKIESKNLYEFCLKNRMDQGQIISYWSENCIHMNKNIQIESNDKIDIGVFIGIGENGEAIIKDSNQQVKSIYSGSLRF